MSDSKREAANSLFKELLTQLKGQGTGALEQAPQNQSSQVSTNIREPIESEMSNAYWKPVAAKAKVEPEEVRRLSLEFGEDIVENLTPEQINEAVIKYVRD